MTPDLTELTALLPPPQAPLNTEGDWAAVEAQLGTALPADYQHFIKTYGTVKMCDYFWINSPFHYSQRYANYLDLIAALQRSYDAVANGRANITYPLYPEKGGLLPVGGTDNGDVISWITQGAPDKWGIFVWVFPGLEVFPLPDKTLTTFLIDLLSKKSSLVPAVFPDDLFDDERRSVIVTP